MVNDSYETVYVPVLKWRKGEKIAIKQLDDRQKNLITPLIELVNDAGDDPRQLNKIIKDYWRNRTAYVDVHLRPRSFATAELRVLASNDEGLDIIPVVRLDTAPIILDEIKHVALRYNNGIAIRICLNLDIDFSILSKEIDLILDQFKIPRNKIDLIIDFGKIDKDADYSESLSSIKKAIKLDDWRRLIIAAGVFPTDLSDFEPNADNFLERTEYTLWNKYNNFVGRKCIFADYTSRGPIYTSKPLPGSKSIRFTLDNKYQVFRGTLQDKSFKYLVHALNIRTLHGDKYNQFFSWGDQIIHGKAKQLEDCLKAGFDPEQFDDFNTGNPGDWVAASVNHHICVVLKNNLS